MLIEVKRKLCKGYTEGVMSIDGKYFCDTIEDEYRDLSVVAKVPGETCIPFGEYRLVLSHSRRFVRVLPEILRVPHFEGIRIHSGNTRVDTEGCILVGHRTAPGVVSNSRQTMGVLMAMLIAKPATELVTIKIS